MPINPKDIVWDEDRKEKPPPQDVKWDSADWKFAGGIMKTLKNLGRVYPAFETAATMATATYGVPISGLIGLAIAPFDLDAANKAIESIQKFLVYQPRTQGGQELTEAAGYPNELLRSAGEYVGSKIENPLVAATTQSLIEASPAFAQIPGTMGKIPSPKLGSVISEGINKGVRPSVVKKELWSQRQKYMQNANVAVDEIISNKKNLRLSDRDGNVTQGRLPKTLEEFSQALEQTKRSIFEEYDALARQANQQGAGVNMTPIISELDGIINHRPMQTLSPETVGYAMKRKQALEGQTFSPLEVQEMVKMLNQSEKAYYANPTPESFGKAHVDALIANNLRSGLDAAIESATGFEYQPLKRRYGAIRMLEADVTKRAIVDARKNIRGLIDFSDIFSSSQLVQGIVAGQPALLASGGVIKAASGVIKWINDPNRIVRSMFEKAERMSAIDTGNKFTVTPGTIVGAMGGIEEEGE